MMDNEDILQILEKQDQEHDFLVQPRELDKKIRRLARIGIWAEANKDAIISSLLITKESTESDEN